MSIKNLFKIILFPALVFVIHLISTYGFNIYQHWNWVDTPMHFLGGMSIAAAAYFYFQALSETNAEIRLDNRHLFIFLVSLAVSAAVVWEMLEFSVDLLIIHHPYFQPDNYDTMKDLITGLAGGSIAAALITFKQSLKRTR